jgi:hypothetical protein
MKPPAKAIDYEPITTTRATQRAELAAKVRALVASVCLPLSIVAITLIVRYRAWEALRWVAWEILIMLAIGAIVSGWTIFRFFRHG